MTLTEFLTARVTEDEALAHTFDWATPDKYEEADLDTSPEYVTLYISPRRVLAECAAKRAIVAFHESHPALPTAPILWALALPYAEHPDYDEAWRI